MVFYSLHTSLSIKNKRPSHQGIPNCPLRRSGLLPSQVSPSGSENELVLALPPHSSRPPACSPLLSGVIIFCHLQPSSDTRTFFSRYFDNLADSGSGWCLIIPAG